MKHLLSALALCLGSCLAPLAGATVVTVGSAVVNDGDTFTIPVSISDAVDLASFQFDLSFNPDVLQLSVNGAAQSAFFTQGDISVFVPGVVDNVAGDLLGVADALIFQPLVNGSGVLVELEFTAINPGLSALTLSNLFLNLSDSGFSVAAGEVCVIDLEFPEGCPRAVPAPAGLPLVMVAGVGAWLGRRRSLLSAVNAGSRP